MNKAQAGNTGRAGAFSRKLNLNEYDNGGAKGYLAYTEYRELGGTLDEPEFNRAELAARKAIGLLTYNRLDGIDPVPEDLKMLALELVERGLCGDLEGNDFTSQGAGKLSGTREGRAARAEELIRTYLGGMKVDGVPVFYAGN